MTTPTKSDANVRASLGCLPRLRWEEVGVTLWQ